MKYFRFSLAVTLICYLHSSKAIKFNAENPSFRNKFSLNEEKENTKRESRWKTLFSKLSSKSDVHSRHRRQAGCCNLAPSSCDTTTPYRTIDGTCNNLAHPCWGSAGMPFLRILPPQYGTSNAPRGVGATVPLPKPRKVAAGMVATATTSKPNDITDICTLWGQFIDHDITFAPDFNVSGCCNGSTNTSCMQLDVSDDNFYRSVNVSCLELGRSIPSSCTGSTREQINRLTAYIDASHIYGSSAAELTALREPSSFRLKIGPGNEITSCPANPPPPTFSCRFTFLPVRTSPATGNPEFFAGDNRVEEQPSLTSMHAIFLRMHNHLGTLIKARNPTCNNEIVFQETRKIMGAVMQQITYNEFLPAVLGDYVMNQFGLYPGTGYAYDSTNDATAFNVFSVAAFRFGHSLVRNTFTMPGGSVVQMSESFNNHGRTLIAGTFPSQFMRAGANDSAEQMDHVLVSAVHNKLFATSPFLHGSDLYSRNVMRGRDHGIRSYINWFNYCQPLGFTISTFDDLYDYMPAQVVDKLKTLYTNRVQDIDLFPAGIAEFKFFNSLLGPTFSCLVGGYFHNLKFGDRFWLEKSGQFKPGQLSAIQDTFLSTILCIFSDATQYQKLVMKKSNNFDNLITSCSTLKTLGVVNAINTSWVLTC